MSTPEALILRFFLKDKENLNRFSYVLSNIILDKEYTLLYKTIEMYYSAIETHTYISKDELTNYFDINYSMLKDKEIIHSLINFIYSLDVSDSLILEVIKNLVEKDTANKIINKLLPVISENKYGVLATVDEDLKQYLSLVSKQDQISPFIEHSLDALLEENVTGESLSWRLECLQNDIGGLRPGLLGHIAARVETGKTSFLASEISHFASQLKDDEICIWFCNEEKGTRIKLRLYNAVLNASTDRILSDVKAAQAAFDKRGGNKIKIVDGATQLSTIRQLCFEYQPKFIVIDQGDKVNFAGAGLMEGPARLKELYYRYRILANEFNTACLTVGQASAEAAGKKWIEMHHLDNSKCLAVGTKVRMFDGSTKPIELVRIGDQLMGVDSTPRNVLSTDRGISEMWRVILTKTGDSFVCNDNHILSTKMSGNYSKNIPNGKVINKTIHQWLALSDSIRYRHRGYYSDAVEYNTGWFSSLDPYFLGAWLGDGSSRSSSITTADFEMENYVYEVAAKFNLAVTEDVSATYKTLHISCGKVNGQNAVLKELQRLKLINNKHILKEVLVARQSDRLEFLAGLIDTDGCLLSSKTHKYFEVATKHKHVADNLVELCRSLGIYASYAIKFVSGVPYYYIYISGNIAQIPTKIKRKQTDFCATTQVTTSPMQIESVGLGEYAGFTLDGDGLYMLDNYIVTHNTGKPGEMDFIITIGKLLDEGEENIRYLNLCKNKLKGIHSKHTVKFDNLTARYADL